MSEQQYLQIDDLRERIGSVIVGMDPKTGAEIYRGILMNVTEEGYVELVPEMGKDANDRVTIKAPTAYNWMDSADLELQERSERVMARVFETVMKDNKW